MSDKNIIEQNKVLFQIFQSLSLSLSLSLTDAHTAVLNCV